MMRSFFKDVRWGYLLLSTILLFCFLLLFGSLSVSVKSELFFFSLKHGMIGWENIYNSGNEFVISSYWAPLNIFCTVSVQILSSIYFLKKTKNVEYTNGLAFGLVSSVFIYQMNVMYSLIAFVVSIIIAYRIKKCNQNSIICHYVGIDKKNRNLPRIVCL
jgi:hypothetical protein